MPKHKVFMYAAAMRKRPTAAEKRFGAILIDVCKILNCSHEPQKIFWHTSQAKAYIVDFYIPDYQVVIEIDGPSHNDIEQAKADAIRDSWFTSHQKRVVRILNSQTFDIGYCQELLYNTLKVKRRAPKRKRIKKIKTTKDAQGITQCAPYTEGHYKRDQFNAYKGHKPRKLIMRINNNNQ